MTFGGNSILRSSRRTGSHLPILLIAAVSLSVLLFLGFSDGYQLRLNRALWFRYFFELARSNQFVEAGDLYDQQPALSPSPVSDTELIPADSVSSDQYISDSVSSQSTETDLVSSPVSSVQLFDPSGFFSANLFAPPDSILPRRDSSAVFDSSTVSDSLLRSDSSSLADSLVRKDSLFLADSLLLPDSLRALLDSLPPDSSAAPVDTTDKRLRDSTARLEQFKTVRDDLFFLRMYQQKQSSFFITPSNKKLVIAIDSSGEFVEVKEIVGTEPTKLVLRMTIEDYLASRIDAREQQLWDELAYTYELKSGKLELTDLLKDITDFEIPLPSVGFLSIFGPPKISLKVGGAVDIHAAWRNETMEGVTASRLGNTKNEPDFKQQVQINVNGTIGDKLQIGADWNTERTFQYENQLKLKYTGYEDEIIKSVEAGNVSLQTSNLVGGSEALFGIKALFQVGPFSLTTLVSQKKAEVKEKEVSGGSTSQDFTIRAPDFSQNHYFIDQIYADTSAGLNLFNKYYGNPVPIIDRRYFVKQIEVWKSINQTLRDPNERNANTYIELDPIFKTDSYPENLRSDAVQEVPGKIVKGRFILLTEGVDYILHAETGYITFKTQVQDAEIIAVAYQIESDNVSSSDDDLFYGEFLNQSAASDTAKRLVLKLVKPQYLQPQHKIAWNLRLKNIYPVGGRNTKKEGFVFDIKYEVDGQEPQNQLSGIKLLNAYGLDLVGESDSPPPDGTFDYKVNLTIIPETGEIIFPFLQPFGRNIPENLPGREQLQYLDIYDTTITIARQNKVKDKWILTGKFSGDASSVYQLGFNVVENSVKVYLGGRELSPGSDYTVDYNLGQLTIRNDAALQPGSNLRITFEENDVFTLASKTLLGARGMYDFSKKTKLGFSILTLSQQTLSDKVRIGEEPLSNTIFGMDFTTAADLPFLTRLLDNVISTSEMSTFTLSGEFAYMMPDPNTKKSTISSDQGNSIAYIDDFEGAKRIIPVGISYGTWKDLSVPGELAGLPDSTNQVKIHYKGKSWWFNNIPQDVLVEDIWPERKVARGDERVTVLDYVFNPDTAGTYNYRPRLDDPTLAWGGMMKMLSSTANNLVDENIEFLEFWMKIGSAEPGAKMYIDLGKISEDVIPNNRLDTEDKNFNDLIDQDEDTGIDGLFDEAERTTFDSDRADPSGDNFVYQTKSEPTLYDYQNINGTQGNAELTDIARIPDTEDLNKNGSLDQVNSFFRYEIPLDTTRANNPFIVGGGNNANWYLIRVPLKDFSLEVGSPSLTLVELIRLYVTGVSDITHIRLAEFNLVGNQWQKMVTPDTVLAISVVNIEDNPDYDSPPGVQRERDRTRPDQEIYKNEQSLNLIIKELEQGDKREAVKYLYRPLDVFNYKEMKLFIHGNKNDSLGSVSYYVNENNYSSEVYFRFGTDSNNYYEYRQPVRSGWNEISILFSELTALKQIRDSSNTEYRQAVIGKPGHFYVVKGLPTLTQVKFLSVGIFHTNNPEISMPVSGQVWVNELRVVGADDTPGWAYTGATSLKLADLLTVNLNYGKTDPFFHKLAGRFGSRTDNTSWSLSADLDVLKLLPFNMEGSSLRVNYSHSEGVGDPLFVPGTDISIEEAKKILVKLAEEAGDKTAGERAAEQLRANSQTVNISDTYSAGSIKLKIPVDYWLIRDTWNALTFSFNYNKTFSRNPTTLYAKAWIWNASVNYNLNLNQNNFVEGIKLPVLGAIFAIFSDYKDAKYYYSPSNLNWQITAKRNQSNTLNRPMGNLSTPVNEIISRDFTATRGFKFSWKLSEKSLLNISTSYSVDIASSLAYMLTDGEERERSESEIWKDIFSGVFFGKDFRYTQVFDIKTQPKLPSLLDLNKYLTIDASYNSNYQWKNDFRQEELGRGAGFANRLSLALKLRLKAMFDPLFETTEVKPKKVEETKKNTRRRDFDQPGDSTKVSPLDSTQIQTAPQDSIPPVDPDAPSTITKALRFFLAGVKYLMLDYENINVDYSNAVTFSASGLKAPNAGFKNFWGLSQDLNDGPSRLFMLGLSQDIGPRALSGNLSDDFSERHQIDLKTSRPLWEGAKIDISWKVGWSMNKRTSFQTDSLGNVSITNITSTGTINRSFLSLPPVLIFSSIGGSIKKVSELYDPAAANQTENLSNAFLEGFESIPIFAKLGFLGDVMKYIPRPNWRLNWTGLENFGLFKSMTKKVSLDHAYTSEYTEGWKIDPDGKKLIQTQKISYGFSPLLSLNITFNQLWGGNLSASVKYNTRTVYDLGITTKNITENLQRDIGINFTYAKSGFELPLFGVNLKNDIEFSFSYMLTKNSAVVFDMNNFIEEGTPQNGTNVITIEPRIKYVISSRVTLALFYKRIETTPEGAARTPPSTRNEAGLDIKISIQ